MIDPKDLKPGDEVWLRATVVQSVSPLDCVAFKVGREHRQFHLLDIHARPVVRKSKAKKKYRIIATYSGLSLCNMDGSEAQVTYGQQIKLSEIE